MRTRTQTRMTMMTALLMVMVAFTSAVDSELANDVDDDQYHSVAEIDYVNQQLMVDLDEQQGQLELTLGKAQMRLEWGTEDNLGAISLLSVQTHYLGVADVFGPNGDHRGRDGIPMKTIFYQRIDGILEYDDLNADGLFNVRGGGTAGSIDELGDSALEHETMLKYIDMRELSWEISGWLQECVDNTCSLVFSLSATNIDYATEDDIAFAGQLEELIFVFHVTTTETTVEVEAMPHYRIRVGPDSPHGDPTITDTEQIGTSNITAQVLDNVWKYDQIVRGWDAALDADGTPRNDTRLFTVIDYGMASFLPGAVARWAQMEFDGLPGPRPFAGQAPHDRPIDVAPEHDQAGHPLRCGAAYVQNHPSDSSDGHGGANGGPADPHSGENNESDAQDQMRDFVATNCVDEGEELESGNVRNATAIRAGAMHFDNNGARMGSIRWVSNATVDGVETEVLFQLHGIRPVLPIDLDNLPNGHYKGVRMVGGYNMVLGDDVLHDPEFEVQVLTIDTQSFGDVIPFSGRPLALLLKIAPLLLLVGVVAVVAVVMTLKRSAKNGAATPPEERYPPAGMVQVIGTDWDEYRVR